MREIKFRAWDVGLKEMIPIDFYNITDQDHQLLGEYADGGFIMQYTGLKDKNGKKIYEGDILQFHGVSGPQKGYHKRIVKWNNDSACFFCEKHGIYTGEQKQSMRNSLKFRHTHEVIGNIYENPELIK